VVAIADVFFYRRLYKAVNIQGGYQSFSKRNSSMKGVAPFCFR
jgi:hypothetical protein